MHGHFVTCVSGALLLAGLSTVSCSDAGPATPTGPSTTQAVALRAEPETVRPEFLLPFGGCTGGRAFRTSFVVIVGGTVGFVVQELRVSFSDWMGIVAVPAVLPAASTFGGSTMMPLPSIPLPSSAPIPIPTAGPNNGLSLSPGPLQRLPVTLEFGCDVRLPGTIVVTAGTRDRRGRRDDHRLVIGVRE